MVAGADLRLFASVSGGVSLAEVRHLSTHQNLNPRSGRIHVHPKRISLRIHHTGHD